MPQKTPSPLFYSVYGEGGLKGTHPIPIFNWNSCCFLLLFPYCFLVLLGHSFTGALSNHLTRLFKCFLVSDECIYN